jgi:hypothetical protein
MLSENDFISRHFAYARHERLAWSLAARWYNILFQNLLGYGLTGDDFIDVYSLVPRGFQGPQNSLGAMYITLYGVPGHNLVESLSSPSSLWRHSREFAYSGTEKAGMLF